MSSGRPVRSQMFSTLKSASSRALNKGHHIKDANFCGDMNTQTKCWFAKLLSMDIPGKTKKLYSNFIARNNQRWVCTLLYVNYWCHQFCFWICVVLYPKQFWKHRLIVCWIEQNKLLDIFTVWFRALVFLLEFLSVNCLLAFKSIKWRELFKSLARQNASQSSILLSGIIIIFANC